MSKKSAGSSRTLAERGVVQADYARAEAALESARALVTVTVAEAWALANAGAVLDAPIRARLRLAATHLTRTAADVVRTAYDTAGGSAVYASHPLQRRFRDAHVATQHMMVAAPTFELAGRALLGLPIDPTTL